jgi:hypothetical protein
MTKEEGIDARVSTVVRKHPFVPISPAHNWGQRPVLEGVLPQGRLR